MILSAHVDDSGSDENGSPPSRYFVLGGYILPVEQWKPFSNAWDKELRRKPSISYFKMSDAEYGDGPFEGMPREFRKLKVNELADVIDKFKPKPITAHLEWSQYASIVRGNVDPKIDSPYAILFYQIIRAAHEWQIQLNRISREVGFHRIDFVFDKQGKVGLRALQWHDGLLDVLPDPYKSMLGDTPGFKDDKEIVALQAANMIAWHIHRHLEKPEEPWPTCVDSSHEAIAEGEERRRDRRMSPYELRRRSNVLPGGSSCLPNSR